MRAKVALSCLLMTVLASMSLGGSVQSDVADPYVEVRVPGGTGSGTVIQVGDETLILTAAHVAECCWKVGKTADLTAPARLVNKRLKIDMKADVLYVGRRHQGGPDLALLRPRGIYGLVPAILLDSLEYELGEDCWYIGTPAGAHSRLEKSIISGINAEDDYVGEEEAKTLITTNGSGWYGSSGGGLFVKREKPIVLSTVPVTVDVGPPGTIETAKFEYVLAGVVVAGDPGRGNPVAQKYAVDHKTIKKFLADYREVKKGVDR